MVAAVVVVVGGGAANCAGVEGLWAASRAWGMAGSAEAVTALVTAPTPSQLTTVAVAVATIQAPSARMAARRIVQWYNPDVLWKAVSAGISGERRYFGPAVS